LAQEPGIYIDGPVIIVASNVYIFHRNKQKYKNPNAIKKGRKKSTCKSNEIRLLSFEHSLEKPSRVEIGAVLELGLQHVSTPSHHSVTKMHISHLNPSQIKTQKKKINIILKNKELIKLGRTVGDGKDLEDFEGTIGAEPEGKIRVSLDANGVVPQ
jgi:hypothetical protein